MKHLVNFDLVLQMCTEAAIWEILKKQETNKSLIVEYSLNKSHNNNNNNNNNLFK